MRQPWHRAADQPAADTPPASAPVVVAPPDEDAIREALRECYDPEIPINIIDLGLVDHIEVSPEGQVRLEMTLTAVGCPEADRLVAEVQERVEQVPGVTACTVALVWNPPWNPEMMSDEGRVMLRILGFG